MITGAKILQRKIVVEIQTTNRQTANDHVIPDMTSHRQDLFGPRESRNVNEATRNLHANGVAPPTSSRALDKSSEEANCPNASRDNALASGTARYLSKTHFPPKPKLPHKIPTQSPSLLAHQHLSQQVRQVRRSILFSNPQNPCRCGFSNRVIVNRVVFLRQSRLRYTRILHDTLIITIHICRSIDRNSKHPQLVSQ